MESKIVVSRLAALAQETRLAIFRLLVQRGPEGLCVSEIQTKLKVPPATLSFHLKELDHAGLVQTRQEGRFIYYSPDFKAMNSLLGYLTDNCCEGEACEVACETPKARRAKKLAA